METSYRRKEAAKNPATIHRGHRFPRFPYDTTPMLRYVSGHLPDVRVPLHSRVRVGDAVAQYRDNRFGITGGVEPLAEFGIHQLAR